MTINANEVRSDEDWTSIEFDDVANSNYFLLFEDSVECPDEKESGNYGSRRLRRLGRSRKRVFFKRMHMRRRARRRQASEA